MATSLESLTLLDYSDRELLWLVYENREEDGYTPTSTIANMVGLSSTGKSNQCVGSRMAWLKKFGATEGGDTKWQVTPIGEVMMRGELSSDDERALSKLKPEQMLLVSRWMGGQYRTSGEEEGHLIRRELRRSMAVNGKR